MTLAPGNGAAARQLYMVLSPRSLGYARCALESLFRNSADAVDLRLITDSVDDRQILFETVAAMQPDERHRWSVTAEDELADAEATRFGAFPHLRAFRHGHPCWRKVTDPLLMSEAGAEMILLDPDLYFPNRFHFEPTAETGLALMWQRPNCLLPPGVVRTAMQVGMKLAHHVDIGVSHWRGGQDLAWLNWMIGRLGGEALPRLMHIEAIVWSAVAMRDGGGYLDPRQWVCWHRTQSKRVRRKLGASGERILVSEPWAHMKCFHAGGEAKWWLPEFLKQHPLPVGKTLATAGTLVPFVELTAARYEREQGAKRLLHSLGYYRVFGNKSA